MLNMRGRSHMNGWMERRKGREGGREGGRKDGTKEGVREGGTKGRRVGKVKGRKMKESRIILHDIRHLYREPSNGGAHLSLTLR